MAGLRKRKINKILIDRNEHELRNLLQSSDVAAKIAVVNVASHLIDELVVVRKRVLNNLHNTVGVVGLDDEAVQAVIHGHTTSESMCVKRAADGGDAGASVVATAEPAHPVRAVWVQMQSRAATQQAKQQQC